MSSHQTNPHLARPRTAGLFAGIGGIELGLEQAGFSTSFLCEVDPAARAVLEQRFCEADLEGDVRLLEELPDVDVLSAGFPCQDLSQAGKTAGIRGTRSGLVDHLFRLLETRSQGPRWLLIENVPFMLRLERGAGMTYLTRRLAELGFRWAYRVVDTRSFGLPQRRQRVILVASQVEDPRDVLFTEDQPSPDDADWGEPGAYGFYWTEGTRGLGWAPDAIPTLKAGSTVGIPSPPAIWRRAEDDLVTPALCDAERLQGFEADWTEPAEAVVPRRAAGARWRLVGNAVSVPVARWIGEQLLRPGSIEAPKAARLPEGASWPIAAWGEGRDVCQADVSMWPRRNPFTPILEFLAEVPRPLSARASAGFAARLSKSSLHVTDEFREAVTRYAAAQMPLAA